MSYGASPGFGRDLGYGGGAKLLHFTQTQTTGMKAAMYIYQNVGIAAAASGDTDDGHIYIYENVGVAPASAEDTEDGHMYIYENVGIAPASTENTEDGHLYIYENVQARPAGSSGTLPPTHN